MLNLIGTSVASRFDVKTLIGSGSMGTVFQALDSRLGRMVAIKVVKSDIATDARFLARLEQEAKIIAQLSSNPHVITVYDLGILEDGRPYLVTEYLSGHSLMWHMARGDRPSRTWILDVALPILSALVDAHAKNIVHRDLKPANVFLMQTETIPLQVKVLDFGLARSRTLSQSESTLEWDGIAGTPKYMAPEMLQGDEASAASDIYALGLILYELSTGYYPYHVHTTGDSIRAHLYMQPAQFPKSPDSLSSEFEELVLRMLIKDPSRRPQSMECYREMSRINSALDHAKYQKFR